MILTHGASSLKVEDDSKVTIGGRDYPVVKIGNRLWLAENLDYMFDVNGSQIPIGGSGNPTTPAAWYYNNNETDYGIDGTYKCGLLYNWYAVSYLETNKSTLLPSGWHVPSQAEYDTLATAVGGASTAGKKLKALNKSVTSNWPTSWNGTDDYGFGVLPAGCRRGDFYDVGSYAYFWTGTPFGNYAYFKKFDMNTTMDQETQPRYYGYSIRLVKTVT